ncbi:PTPN2 [Bugula neritina]|uniref:protein-tyrosine-phosphatase n=1 Tax=Bugula neritina TaxID=10212 RepID=A0A7J7KIE6_BUGNE|nr:PTPN2 [Bugula neritina]
MVWGPAVIHCSAGIGRSGTFCLVDAALVLIDRGASLADLNLRQLLLEMRSYREYMIQTPDQLRFAYLSVIDSLKTKEVGETGDPACASNS